MRPLILAAALVLAGCAFSADTPLFSSQDAAFPIPDGAILELRDPDSASAPERMLFHATPQGYVVREPGAAQDAAQGPAPVLFVAVTDTPEEDYIVSMPMDDAGPGVNFAFAWRAADGFHLISDPDEFEDAPDAQAWLAAHTDALSYGARRFTRREDVITFHRDFVAPRFIRGGATPEDVLILAAAR